MNELLRALDRAARRRWLWFAAAAAVGIVAMTVGVIATRERAELCAPPRLVGVWDAPRRVQLATALAATGKPFASIAAHQVTTALDAHAAALSTAHIDACRATHVRHVQSPDLLDRRMQCLEERRAELAGLVDVLVRGELAAEGVRLVRELVPIDRCADLAALATRIAPPATTALANEVHALRLAMARVRGQQITGHYRVALPDAIAMLAKARALGYGPIIAEAALVLGTLQIRVGVYPAARLTLQEAARVATSVFDNHTAAEAWTSLVEVEGVGLRDFTAADQDSAWAQSLLGDVPDTRLMTTRSKLAVLRGKPKDAEDLLRKVLAIQEAQYGNDDRMVADTLDQLGVAISQQDRAAEAQPFHERANAIRERTLGADHPDRATTLERLGLLASGSGKHDEAIALLRQAVALRRAGLGESHPLLGAALSNLGLALRRAKHDTEALSVQREALAVRERALGPDHPDVAISTMNIANVLGSTNHCDEALTLHQRVVAIMEHAYGPTHPRTADALMNVASAHKCLGHAQEAIEPYRRVLAIHEARLGPNSTQVGHVLSALGEALIDAGQLGEAVRVLERSYEIIEHADHIDPEEKVVVKYSLGDAIWRDTVARNVTDRAARTRARSLVERALRELLTQRTAAPSDVRDLQTWLATHTAHADSPRTGHRSVEIP
jgi:tetratricopeptide (TPR) repeat protein